MAMDRIRPPAFGIFRRAQARLMLMMLALLGPAKAADRIRPQVFSAKTFGDMLV